MTLFTNLTIAYKATLSSYSQIGTSTEYPLQHNAGYADGVTLIEQTCDITTRRLTPSRAFVEIKSTRLQFILTSDENNLKTITTKKYTVNFFGESADPRPYTNKFKD